MELQTGTDDRTSESDVEQKIVFPLLTLASGLAIPVDNVRTKQVIRPLDVGKGAKRRVGYIPDYLVWYESFPLMVVEVKAPRVSADLAYEEAQQYAHSLNTRYVTGINPAHFVIGLESLGFARNFLSSCELEALHFIGIRPFGEEFREDVAFRGIQEEFGKPLA